MPKLPQTRGLNVSTSHRAVSMENIRYRQRNAEQTDTTSREIALKPMRISASDDFMTLTNSFPLVATAPIAMSRSSVPVIQSSPLSGWKYRASNIWRKPTGMPILDASTQSESQTRKVVDLGTSSATSYNIGVLRNSALPSAEAIIGRLPYRIGKAMRIFRKSLEIPNVRIHNDTSSNIMAARLNAEAFTVGRDIFFAAGKSNLSTPSGIALLAHELTHVKQQEKQGANLSYMTTSRYSGMESEALVNEGAILSFLSHRPQVFASPQANVPMAIARKAEDFKDAQMELVYVNRSQAQNSIPQGNPDVLKAEAGRDIEAHVPPEPSTSVPSAVTMPRTDIYQIANEVYSIIEKRLRSEKEARGYF